MVVFLDTQPGPSPVGYGVSDRNEPLPLATFFLDDLATLTPALRDKALEAPFEEILCLGGELQLTAIRFISMTHRIGPARREASFSGEAGSRGKGMGLPRVCRPTSNSCSPRAEPRLTAFSGRCRSKPTPRGWLSSPFRAGRSASSWRSPCRPRSAPKTTTTRRSGSTE